MLFHTGDSEHGVSIADEESLFGHLENFCSRLRQLLDIINTLVQYGKLAHNAEGLPRPRKDDLAVEEGSLEETVDASTPAAIQSEVDGKNFDCHQKEGSCPKLKQ